MKSFFSWFSPERRRARDKELERELRSHLEAEADERREDGAGGDEANHAARRAMGNLLRVTEETRAVWGWVTIERALQDARFALRTMRKNLGFSLVAVLVLALGIGANTAIFSVVNAALLHALPFDDADRVVQIWQTPPQKTFPGVRRFAVAVGNYVEWERQQKSFDKIALYGFKGLNLGGNGQPDALNGAGVTTDFFSVLRVQPLLGRTFTADEMEEGRDREVILGYDLWQTRFGADLSVVGKTATFDGQTYTIVGVMPRDFLMPDWANFWVPYGLNDKARAERVNHNRLVIARLKPGVTMQQAQADLEAISHRLEQEYPADNTGWGAMAIPLREQLVGKVRQPLYVMLGAVGLVLLIACSNIANLVLSKMFSRRKEFAIRSALGASRGRVVQHMMAETVVLALIGGALGLLIAHYGVQLLISFFGSQLPKMLAINLDGEVLAFTAGIALLAGILAGLLPALRLTQGTLDLHQQLQQSAGRTSSEAGGNRVRAALVTAEVAMSMVLLIGAGLLIRSLWKLQSIPPGFDPHNLLTMQFPVLRGKYSSPEQQSQFLNAMLQHVRALPGLDSAAMVADLPTGKNASNWPVQIEGQPVLPVSQQPIMVANTISDQYFHTMRIPILHGRDFTAADSLGRPLTAIISETAAKQFWPNQDPIGHRIITGFGSHEPREVVGVVGDVKELGLDQLAPVALLYMPILQETEPGGALVLRSANGPSTEMTSAVTHAVRELEPDQPVLQAATMDQVISDSLSSQRVNMTLLAVFAGLALVLAAVGIYSVLAYSVRRRVREIGIRLALGAQRSAVMRLVLVEGMQPTLLGLGLGLVGALALGSVLSSLVYGIKTTDIATYAAISALLAVVGLCASLIPAWRATQVEPLKTLRDE